MTAHTIGAVNIIANPGPIAGIGNISIVIVDIVIINVVIVDRFFSVIVSNIVVSNNITNITSIQQPPSLIPRQLSPIRITKP